jgi:hypothetical protein
MKLTSDELLDLGVVGFCILFIGWGLAAEITHVITCIQNSEWLFLIAGAIAVQVAWIHGTGIWFGVW